MSLRQRQQGAADDGPGQPVGEERIRIARSSGRGRSGIDRTTALVVFLMVAAVLGVSVVALRSRTTDAPVAPTPPAEVKLPVRLPPAVIKAEEKPNPRPQPDVAAERRPSPLEDSDGFSAEGMQPPLFVPPQAEEEARKVRESAGAGKRHWGTRTLFSDVCESASASPSQIWEVPSRRARGRLRLAVAGTCLASEGGAASKNALVVAKECRGGDETQAWQFEDDEGSSEVFRIAAVGLARKVYLDRHSGNVPYSTVWLWDWHKKRMQKWRTRKVPGENRGVQIVAAENPRLCLTSRDLPEVGVVTVHVIEHTHNDWGWHKPPEQYYSQHVRGILDSAVQGLLADKNRRYTYVESAFLKTWWDEQDKPRRDQLRQLVKSDQFHVVNGGWTMNDEACTHYSDIIDNMVLGHSWLMSNFGFVPTTVGWTLDDFGHSAGQAYLYSKMGFDFFCFSRVPDGIPKPMQFLWNPFADVGGNARILTYYHAEYCGEPPNVDDALAMESWAEDRRHDAVRLGTNQVMLLFGCDFTMPTYNQGDRVAHYYERHPELGLRVVRSNPEMFYRALLAEGNSGPRMSFDPPANDLFPYWTGFFTSRQDVKKVARSASSYYHAATALHTLVSAKYPPILLPGGQPLSATKAMMEQVGLLNVLWMGIGSVSHHDGITGTSTPETMDDYKRRLKYGMDLSKPVVEWLVTSQLTGRTPGDDEPLGSSESGTAVVPLAAGQVRQCLPHGWYPNFCPSFDKATGNTPGAPEEFVVTVLNSLPWESDLVVQVPLPQSSSDNSTASYILKAGSSDPQIVAQINRQDNALIFSAKQLPPLGTKSYRLTKLGQGSSNSSSVAVAARALAPNEDFSIANEFMSLKFEGQRGELSEVTVFQSASGTVYKKPQVSKAKLEVLYYGSAADGNDGAYDFRARPDNALRFTRPKGSSVSVTKGPLCEVVEYGALDVASKIRMKVSLCKGERYARIVTDVDHIDTAQGGKNVVMRVTVDSVRNGLGRFYTDSNGVEFVRRTKHSWKFLKGPRDDLLNPGKNYYPVTTMAYIRDDDEDEEYNSLALVADRSEGASSLGQGQLEVMIGRRLLVHDGKGLDFWPLDVDYEVQSVHMLVVSLNDEEGDQAEEFVESIKQVKLLGHLLNNPPMVFASGPVVKDAGGYQEFVLPKEFRPLSGSGLPRGVVVQSLATYRNNFTMPQCPSCHRAADRQEGAMAGVKDGGVVLRLMNLFNNKEGKTQRVDLGAMFNPAEYSVSGVEEHTMTLSRTKLEETRAKSRLQWVGAGKPGLWVPKRDSANVPDEADDHREIPRATSKQQGLAIDLPPLEIRTFVIDLRPATGGV